MLDSLLRLKDSELRCLAQSLQSDSGAIDNATLDRLAVQMGLPSQRDRSCPLTAEQLEQKCRCEVSLYEFVLAAWPVIEPYKRFVPNWHIEAVCDHLMAVASRQIKRLIINIPPRSSKSTLVAIAWPAWVWIHQPGHQWLCLSNAERLAISHTRKMRQLVESRWYQTRWPLTFAHDQNQKMRFENDSGGQRLAAGFTSSIIGEGGDTILCLWGACAIITDRGPVPISEVVEKRLQVSVLTCKHDGVARWSRIERHERFAGRASVRVKTVSGREIYCTADHPFFVPGVGYVRAKNLKPGTRLIKISQAAQAEYGGLRPVRKSVLSPAQALSAGETRAVLQPSLLGTLRARTKQPRIRRRGKRACVQMVRRAVYRKAKRGDAEALLLKAMPSGGSLVDAHDRPYHKPLFWMRAGHSYFPAGHRQAKVLLKNLCQHVARQTYVGRGKPEVRQRRVVQAVQARVPQRSSRSQKKRWKCVPSLRDDRKAAREAVRRSSRGLLQGQQRRVKLDLPLSVLPRHAPWIEQVACSLEEETVECVEIIADIPQYVYNLKTRDANFFANGLLVHNCDDPHDRDDAMSEQKRQRAIEEYDEKVSTRLNDPNRGAIVVIGQRLHQDDLFGHLLETGDWDHLVIPMRYERDHPYPSKTALGWRDPRTTDGELMCVRRFPEETVQMAERTMGAYGAAGQFQQRPAPKGGGMFQRDWFTVQKWPTGERRGRWPQSLASIRYWDLASSTTEAADYTAGCLMSRLADERWVIEDMVHGRWSPAKRDKVIVQTAASDGAGVMVFIEQEGGASGSSMILHYVRLLVGYAVYGDRPDRSKVARASVMAPMAEAGQIILAEGPWVAAFLDELSIFPHGKHDDQVDAACGAYNRLLALPSYYLGGELTASGEDPEDERRPFTAEESAELPDDLRSIIDDIQQHSAGSRGRRGEDDDQDWR